MLLCQHLSLSLLLLPHTGAGRGLVELAGPFSKNTVLLFRSELACADQDRRKDRLELIESKERCCRNGQHWECRGKPASPKSSEKGCYSPVLERHESFNKDGLAKATSLFQRGKYGPSSD